MARLASSCIVVACACIVSAWAVDPLVDALITDSFTPEEVDRRALVNAASASAIAGAAKGFVSNLGKTSAIGGRLDQSFEDACLGKDRIRWPTINPINPIINPINPWLTKGGISSGSNILSSLGKRAAEAKTAANRDIVFVMDTSGSIPQDQFDKARKAISLLVESFCPSKFGSAVTAEGTKQVAVVLFGATVTTEINFADSAKGLGFIQDKIMSMTHRRDGSTATGDALTYVKNKVLGKGASRLTNNDVATDVIVITDGQCNRNCRVLGSEADAIRKLGHGVNVFAMGVANARACELEIITGSGSNMAFGLGDFRNFDRFAEAVKEIALESDAKCA